MKKSSALGSTWRAWYPQLGQAILAGLFFVSSGHSATAQGLEARAIEPYGEAFTTALAAPAAQGRIFIYRGAQTNQALPINIYLNGQYHASLLRGGFTEFCAAPGSINVKAALDDASKQHTSKQDAGQRMNFRAGQTLYLKVNESSSALTLQPAAESQIPQDLQGTRRQVHTISRAKAAQTCAEPAVAAAPKPQVPREYALEADALFEFGKAEIRAAGFNAIELLVQRVRQDFEAVDRIRVVGYTDPIGSAAFNRKLSQDRADVVARQIASRNIKVDRGIEAEGRGSIELAKTGCGNTPTPENKVCHAPNRRVMVVITGARR